MMKIAQKFISLFLLLSLLLLLPFTEAKGAEKVTFNFVDVELTAITKFISEVTKKNFIFDERLKGKITIIAPSELSIDDAYNLFTSVLELKRFTVVPSGINVYKIIPSAEARHLGLEIVTERQPVDESYIARLIPLKHISADDAVRFIQPIISRDGYISAFGHRNYLLIVDSGLNIEKILFLLEKIDQPVTVEKPDVVFLEHTSADAIARILNEALARRAKPAPRIGVVEEARAVADPRLNAVVLFGDKETREAMKTLIAMLDIPSPEARGMINVYFLENADATELAKVLEGMLKGLHAPRPPAPGTPPVTPFEIGVISITPDKATNSLVIVASPNDYQNLTQIIKQLDRRRRQVFVEAMVVEASIDRLRDIGVRWRAVGRHEGEPLVIGGVGTIDASAILSIIQGLGGLAIGGMGNFLTIPVIRPDGTMTNITVPGFAALFSLKEFEGAINVLSTPQILTSDNKEAEIVVGENVPFITKREADPARPAAIFQTIERRDVGITLRITPQITEGDYVKLDIYQEMSALKPLDMELLMAVGPTTTKRATKTSIVLKDGQTVVIGGLIEEKDEETITKVPLLGDIPILGWLFKYKTTSKGKTNLLVFLTPHIVKDAEHLGRITTDKEKEFMRVKNQYIEGELLVRFKDEITYEKALSLIAQKGASLIRFMDDINVYHIKLREGQSVESAIEEFSAMPEVRYAEPNYKIKIR